MTTPAVLVVSSVHPADDPRIRQKLTETLRSEANVTLAVPAPGPVDRTGIDVELLRGPRVLRSLHASWDIIRGRYDVASVHDPELLPAAILAGMIGRNVVFDVHEDIPAQIRHKERIAPVLRRGLAMAASLVLQLAERTIEITLAEPNYQGRFARDHAVFPNTLPAEMPQRTPIEERDGIVYLGDITRQRGADLAIEAAARIVPRRRLTLIGRCTPDLRSDLTSAARRLDVPVTFAGYLPHTQALELMGRHELGISPLRDIPNYRYSLPTKLLEYLAMGLPVVASDLPGAKAELSEQHAIEWVLAGDARALADGIRRVLNDPQRAREADGAARMIRDTFRWPDREVLEFYLSVAGC